MNKFLLITSLALLAGCDGGGGSSNNTTTTAPEPAVNPTFAYEISVVNLTTGQPLSPVGVFIHEPAPTVFSIGAPASDALEIMAEGGDIGALLDAIDSIVETSGEAPVAPGEEQVFSLQLSAANTSSFQLTVLSMLVNTNDAFTAVSDVSIAALEVNNSLEFPSPAYDAGTEANSEATGTIPGPADGGEGFSSARDDIADQVTLHGGVVTADDGLAVSALNQMHRFDNPVAWVRITRTQ